MKKKKKMNKQIMMMLMISRWQKVEGPKKPIRGAVRGTEFGFEEVKSVGLRNGTDAGKDGVRTRNKLFHLQG